LKSSRGGANSKLEKESEKVTERGIDSRRLHLAEGTSETEIARTSMVMRKVVEELMSRSERDSDCD